MGRDRPGAVEPPRQRGRTASRAVRRHGEAGAHRTLLRVIGTAAALVLVVLLVRGLRRAAGPRDPAGPLASGPLVVVEGEVAEPGAVAIPEGASVCDLVVLAGGDEKQLDLESCGRAAAPWTRVTVQDGGVTVVALSPGERFALGGTLDPNRADAGDLAEVPGLSDQLAARVVEERQRSAYCAIEELERVRGIGPRKIEWIRPFLSIDRVAAGCPPSP